MRKENEHQAKLLEGDAGYRAKPDAPWVFAEQGKRKRNMKVII